MDLTSPHPRLPSTHDTDFVQDSTLHASSFFRPPLTSIHDTDFTQTCSSSRVGSTQDATSLCHPPLTSTHDTDFLRSFTEIPLKYRSVFDSYPCFNSVQSQVFDHVFNSNESVVVAAPTGSGKTVIFEIAIIKLLMDMDGCNTNRTFKMVYISPVKALCRERYNDWNPRFAPLGVSCIEVTGDGGDYFDLLPHHLIITTPEKFDSLTRKWRDNVGLGQAIKLFMVDEVHLLNDPKRGPVLEAIVCRMKTIAGTHMTSSLRFLAVSATIFNVEDLAEWLGSTRFPAHCHKFGNEVRPVMLTKLVKGYGSAATQNSFFFDIQLSYKLKPLILEHAKGRPVLVFCSTRKSVVQTAQTLSEQLTFHLSENQRSKLYEGAIGVTDGKLKDLLSLGLGYHHAGMTPNDRFIVQSLFSRGSLPLLVATSTLAMGVNLPAHLVIVKGTQQFIAGSVVEYSESAILQMIGRAGRPQFDTTATAVIMTKTHMVGKYQRMLDSKEVVESNLHRHLPEHLNSEVVLLTITDVGVAMEWIRSSFLYVRALKNPKYYGFDAKPGDPRIEKSLEAICSKELNALTKAGLIEVKDNGLDICPTSHGRLMSHYYVSLETFKIFISLEPNRTMCDLLAALSEAQEFSEVQLRVNERKTLNELNRSKNRECIRYPLAGKIKTRAMKVNCLMQACLGCLYVQDSALQQEAARIVYLAERLAKCMAEIVTKKACYQSVVNAMLLTKCLHAKMWEDVPYVSRQLDKIGPTLGALLAACGKTTFEAIEASNPRDLERILNRAPPFGNYLQEAVRHLPKYDVQVICTKHDNGDDIAITVSLKNAEMLMETCTAGQRHAATLLVGDSANRLLLYRRIADETLKQKPVMVTVTCRAPNIPHQVVAKLVSEQWVGVDVTRDVIVDGSLRRAAASPRRWTGVTETPSKKRKVKKSGCENLKSDYWSPTTSGTIHNFDFFLEAKRVLSEVTDQTNKPCKPVVKKPASSTFVSCFDVSIDENVIRPALRETIVNTADRPKEVAVCANSYEPQKFYRKINFETSGGPEKITAGLPSMKSPSAKAVEVSGLSQFCSNRAVGRPEPWSREVSARDPEDSQFSFDRAVGRPDAWSREVSARDPEDSQFSFDKAVGRPEAWSREVSAREPEDSQFSFDRAVGGPETWSRELSARDPEDSQFSFDRTVGRPEAWSREVSARDSEDSQFSFDRAVGGPETWSRELSARDPEDSQFSFDRTVGRPEAWSREVSARDPEDSQFSFDSAVGRPEPWSREVSARDSEDSQFGNDAVGQGSQDVGADFPRIEGPLHVKIFTPNRRFNVSHIRPPCTVPVPSSEDLSKLRHNRNALVELTSTDRQTSPVPQTTREPCTRSLLSWNEIFVKLRSVKHGGMASQRTD